MIESVTTLIPVGRGSWDIEGRSYPNLTVVNGEGSGGDAFTVSVSPEFKDHEAVKLMVASKFRLSIRKDDRKGGRIKLQLLGLAA